MCHYHEELYTVLHSFTTAGPHLRNVMLPLRPTGFIHVDIITPCILFVIPDAIQEGGDVLVCRQFGSHTTSIQHHGGRACNNVSADDLDNPNAACSFLEAKAMAQIATSLDKQMFHLQWSQHFLNNAFDHRVPMADPIRGYLAQHQ